MDKLKFTILGCGSSGGVPRLGSNWGACDPANPKNRRLRCSMLVQRVGLNGTTNLLIDTTPDMRQQLLAADIGQLDAVIYTHEHADHLHGLDDLRMVVLNSGKRLSVYAADYTRRAVLDRFGYAFETPKGSDYPPILEMHPLTAATQIKGNGGPIDITSFDVKHGRIYVSALKINNLLYTPDISAIFEGSEHQFKGLDYWIIDALRMRDHPSHFSLNDALHNIEKYNPKQAVLTNMHIDLDYDTVKGTTPDNVTPAFDMMQIEMDIA